MKNDADIKTIGVALVDYEPAARLGIRCYLESVTDMRLSEEIESPKMIETLFNETVPDVALIDSECDGGSGLHLIRRARYESPRFPCVALVRQGRAVQVLQAIKAGARGIVCRQDRLSEISLALRLAFSGETHLSPLAAAALGNGLRSEAGFGQKVSLPSRQQQIFNLLGEGIIVPVIAQRLGISLKTVHTHIDRLKRRMDCPNKTALCRLAAIELAREGILSP